MQLETTRGWRNGCSRLKGWARIQSHWMKNSALQWTFTTVISVARK
uniref:Uncharacterized protein n=1 Tax=Pristionchus pacificus TaxID=54126 RepID=A0A2A6BW17_PRIPA|eukprot:PDM70058.1 hypothetical protein PRIPAC_49270 [Pristionchus pacificus]